MTIAERVCELHNIHRNQAELFVRHWQGERYPDFVNRLGRDGVYQAAMRDIDAQVNMTCFEVCAEMVEGTPMYPLLMLLAQHHKSVVGLYADPVEQALSALAPWADDDEGFNELAQLLRAL